MHLKKSNHDKFFPDFILHTAFQILLFAVLNTNF